MNFIRTTSGAHENEILQRIFLTSSNRHRKSDAEGRAKQAVDFATKIAAVGTAINLSAPL